MDYIIDKYTLKFVHLAFEISHFSSSSKWSPRHPHLNKIFGKTLANLSQLRHLCYIHHFRRDHHFSRGLFVVSFEFSSNPWRIFEMNTWRVLTMKVGDLLYRLGFLFTTHSFWEADYKETGQQDRHSHRGLHLI